MTFVPLDSEPDDESVTVTSAESKAPNAVERKIVELNSSGPAAIESALVKPATLEPPVPTPAARKPAARKPAVRKPAAGASASASAAATAKKSTAPGPNASTSSDTTDTTTQPIARKPTVRKPAVRKASVPASTTAPAPSAATTSSLANSATDETTRPYATRDALQDRLRTAAPTDPAAPDPQTEVPAELEPQTEVPAELQTAPQSAPKTAPRTAPKAGPKASLKAQPKSVPASVAKPAPIVIEARGLIKRFGQTIAVSDLNLTVRAGSFYGIVGPNGAGKTTTLSMITGLLRPAAGTVTVHGIDVWKRPNDAKRVIGVLPDRLRLFDRLTGAQLLYYAGTLRGLDNDTVRTRSADLAAAFGLEDALNRLVADYSAGMTKKIALACAMIHSPRVLVLDEPFESVDPVSAVNVTEILQKYVAAGGTVVLSSHGMDLIQRVCDHVAIIVQGRVLAAGTVDEVRGQKTLEDRFVELAGGRKVAEGMEWLHNFSA
ncbi:ATP-binding cassette domain-containing protein [Cryobacterium sp. Hh7]|uniref:ATP-binding cassette domain-containing protein n=1 Tax=Cryobacterium sp. Hh7 TaxID=1259159 RepID=UPI00351A5B4F